MSLPANARRPLPPNAGKGRKKGSLNKVTKSVKEALEETFERLGGVEFLREWAEENPTEFLKLWSKLLPTGMHLEVEHRLTLGQLLGMTRDDYNAPSPSATPCILGGGE